MSRGLDRQLKSTGVTLMLVVAAPISASGSSTISGTQGEVSAERRAPVESDFDGDGYTDLAIGASSDSRSGGTEGSVTIMYGPIDADSVPRVELLTQLTAEPDEATGRDHFGDALAVGDFDGDSYADLAVGAPRRSEGDVFGNGSVYVFFGSGSGVSSGRSIVLTQSDFSVPLERQGVAFFGDELVAGDLDGDGADDLAIGALSSYVRGRQSAGAVYVAMGGGEGPTPSARITQASAGVPGRATKQHYFGASLALGQLGEGQALDLVVGMPGERDRGRPFVGSMFVLYGGGDGSFGRIERIRHRQSRHPVKDGLPSFGSELVVADFGRSALDDVAVAAPGEGAGGVTRVLYGRSNGVTTGDSQRITIKSLGFKRDAFIFGASLDAGDLGRGPHKDLVIGDFLREVKGKKGAGAAVVVYGAKPGLRKRSGQLLTRPKLSGGPARYHANFSAGLAIGDFSGEGSCGLAVGIPGAYGATNAGEQVLVLAASPNGPQQGSAKTWNQNLLFGAGERHRYDQFAGSMASACD